MHFSSYNKIVVAEHKGRIIGYVISEINNGYCHIISLGVDNRYRRIGVGKSLLSALEQLTKSLCQKMSLYVHVENNPAIMFYQKIGLTVEKTVNGYYNGANFEKSNDDAFFMTKNLV